MNEAVEALACLGVVLLGLYVFIYCCIVEINKESKRE